MITYGTYFKSLPTALLVIGRGLTLAWMSLWWTEGGREVRPKVACWRLEKVGEGWMRGGV